MVALSIWAAFQLSAEAKIPIHWGLDGEPNRYTHKGFALVALPAIALFQIGFLAAIPQIPGQKQQIEKSTHFYLTGWISSIAVLGFIHASVLMGAINDSYPSLALIMGVASIMIGILGNYMAKSKSNHWAGLRTPWTLRSAHAWMVGNRFAGLGLVLTAILTLTCLALSQDRLLVPVFFAGNVTTLVLSLVMSFRAAKNDPDQAFKADP